MRINIQNLLHKTEDKKPNSLRGTVHAQFVRCGKSNCKCAKGELHGAYFYHFVRSNGKLIKRYLKADEVMETQTACRRFREVQQHQREQLNEIVSQLREFSSQIKTLHKQK